MFVKICGITSEQDALLAVAMGADAVGFIFAPSPRQVAVSTAAEIVKRLPPEIVTVGVFKDALAERVVEVVAEVGLKAAQLHGRESREEVGYVAERVRFTIKAFPATSAALDEAASYRANAVLVDAPSPGSGKVFDWRIAEGLPRTRRIILAGGLTPDNVGDAIRRVHPWGVDVSSGVEASPGLKDARKVRAFVQAARAAEPERHVSAEDGPYDWQEEW